MEVDDDFDPAMISEALQLSDELTNGDAALVPATSADVQAATRTRNRMLVLLTDRVTAVRRAAAHVFRKPPDITREATSTYERRRRATARRKKLAEEKNEKKDE